MRNSVYLLLFLIPSAIFAGSEFEHPVVIHPGDLYTKIRMEYDQRESREDEIFERKRTLKGEIEYEFLNYFSALLNAGRTYREKTDTKKNSYPERTCIGLKGVYRKSESLFSGIFLNYHSPLLNTPQREGEEPKYFLLEGGVSLGYKQNNIQFMANLIFQTESNMLFKEKYDQQFRRHSQFDLGFSWNYFKWIVLHLETSYREPYNRKIDLKTRFWNLYPGISLPASNYGTFFAAFIIPIAGQIKERGANISFAVFR